MVVHPDSSRISRVLLYLGLENFAFFDFEYGTFTLFRLSSHIVPLSPILKRLSYGSAISIPLPDISNGHILLH